MSLSDIGRICVKKSGREAGKRCVIVDILDKNFVVVTGPKDVTTVKKRRANVDHLDLTDLKVEISRGASDDEVKEALKKLDAVQATPPPVSAPKAEAKKVAAKPKPKAKAKAKKTKAEKTETKKAKDEAASK